MRNLIIKSSIFIFLFSGSIHASEFRMSPSELKQNLDNPELIILDARSAGDYDVIHIKNAINFPVDLTFTNKKRDGQIQKPIEMQRYLRERGINTNSNVLIYDGGKLIEAARLFWTLEVYGLTNVKILDHGFNDWLNRQFPTSQNTPTIVASEYIATINHQRLSSKFATQRAIYNDNKIVIDARSSEAYKGEVSVAKRFGHIPTAINIPFNSNIILDMNYAALKSVQELKKLYSDIPHGKKVIIYCKIGLVSSTNYFALRELGYDVSNYDASWREWGNDESLPIEK